MNLKLKKMKIVINKKTILYASTKLALMLLYILLTSCKSSKFGCDAYGSNFEIQEDSIIVKVNHCHIEKENYCFYSVDTIFSKK